MAQSSRFTVVSDRLVHLPTGMGAIWSGRFTAVSNYLVLLLIGNPPFIGYSFQSRVESPGSSTGTPSSAAFRSFTAVLNNLVLLLAKKLGLPPQCFRAVSNYLVLLLLTLRAFASCCFTAVSHHLVLLRVNRGGIVYYGFRAVPNHLVLLHSRWCSRTGAGVSQPHRAIRTLHGSLLSGSARSAFPAGSDRLARAFFGSGNTVLVSPLC